MHIREILVHWPFLEISGPQKWVVGATLALKHNFLAGTLWSSGAIGLQNPRSLLRLVWWNNVTHLGMRAFKEQYDCQIEDFTVNEEYVEYKERQTKNRQGDEGSSRKRARKYNTKIWKTDGGETAPYRAFVEYVGHRPQGDKVPGNFFLYSS